MLSGSIARRIAARYFFSKKSHSVINLISIITIVSIAVPTAAMIILLSVHNGFEAFIGRLWTTIDTPLVVESKTGRYFSRDSVDLTGIAGIELVSYYIEDDVLLRYKERQTIAKVRGVDSAYRAMTSIDKIVIQGSAAVEEGALVGAGIVYQLGLQLNLSESFSLIAPSTAEYNFFDPTSLYHEVKIPLKGVFALDAQRDAEMLFVSLEQAQELFSRNGMVTAIALRARSDLKSTIQNRVGSGFVVKDIFDQNELEYKLVRSEKVAIYLILLLVMIVASLTLIGTILMLIIEKKENMVSLYMLGVRGCESRKIFVYLGLLISLIGTVGGLVLGLGVSLAQQQWGFVPIQGASLLVDSYPIKVIFSDTVLVVSSVLLITFIISWSSCKLSIKD